MGALNNLRYAIEKNDTSFQAAEVSNKLCEDLFKIQDIFFKSLDPTLSEADLIFKIDDFHNACKNKIIIADKIMGHGWLYRTTEVLIKAVIGLFAGIGMVLAAPFGRGLANLDHRNKFKGVFFTLKENKNSKALESFENGYCNSLLRNLILKNRLQ